MQRQKSEYYYDEDERWNKCLSEKNLVIFNIWNKKQLLISYPWSESREEEDRER